MTAQVYFIGAGPGDPELLTVKAKRIIGQADVIIYADSLINPDICSFTQAGAEIHRSASLNLEEITRIIIEAVNQGKLVARLQSGDPAIYGAIREQMDILDEKGIDYEVVPGISSLFAAAATLKKELTVPGVSQTVIITRQEGQTPVPVVENLKSLATHRTSLAVFLSASLVEEVTNDLMSGGYRPDTPAAVVYRASWPDEKIVRTTLDNLADDVEAADITRQALILVGEFLKDGKAKQASQLYNRDFKHGYRT